MQMSSVAIGAGGSVSSHNPNSSSSSRTLSAPQHTQLIEHVLHGSVGEGVALGLLEERLRGCTDSMDSFFDHEAHYTMAQFGMGGATIGVRLRRSCLSDQMASAYQLRYQGMNEGARDRSKPTVSRTVITVALTPPHTGERERGEGAHKFLEDMGFKLDFHLVLKGNVFVKDRLRVTVSRVFRVTAGAGAEGEKECEMHMRATYLDRHLQPVFPSTLLVEASCTAPTHLPQDEVGDELKAFVEHLKPLITMDKIEHR
ncbi:mediator of RNA polymerase II transcription subunit 18-like isoform X2 [Symsagittifera roscoffensis]|uniref:mediator of RNA polymerase II transcription subunit 18-like isoform X2 n=1 Tax=Symsagittifera roscoffensis TaxID=84072 RepID=UPI00307BBDFD